MRLNVIQLFINSSIMMSNYLSRSLQVNYMQQVLNRDNRSMLWSCAFYFTYIFSRQLIPIPKMLLLAGFLSSSITFFIQMFAYDPISLAIIRALAGFSVGIYPAVLILYVYNLKQSIGKFSSFMPLGWALET